MQFEMMEERKRKLEEGKQTLVAIAMITVHYLFPS